MIEGHIYELKKVSDQYKANLPELVEIYSTLQTKYLSEDLRAGKPIINAMTNAVYANKALDAIKEYYNNSEPTDVLDPWGLC